MKIALVVTGGLHPSGRIETIPALAAYVRRLAEQHDVHAFSLRHLPIPQRYTLGRAMVHDLGRPGGRFRQYLALDRALGQSGPFDVIHGYWVDPAGLAAAIAGKRRNIPTVVTCASGEFASLPHIQYGLQRTWRGRAVTQIACRLATVVHVTSDHMSTLAQRHRIDAIRIPFGVDLRNSEGRMSRHDGPPWRLVQVASLNRVKSQSTLLHALVKVRATCDVHLDLVGEDTLIGRLQHTTRELGLSDAVTFHGFVPQDRLGALYAGAHLYVQSSLHEAAGISVLEAAAAGVPIVGTRAGFVADWDGDAAVAVPPGDADALAAAITSLLSEPQRRQKLAASACERVQAYSIENTVREMVALYQRCIAQARRGG